MNSNETLNLLLQATNWITLGGLLIVLLAETAAAQNRRSWPLRARHIGRNLGLWLLGVGLTSWLFGLSFLEAQRILEARQVGLLRQFALAPWLAALLGLLAFDFADYVFHRLSHRVRWIWLLHAVHHSDREIDVSTNLRQHPVHILVMILWKLVVTTAIGIPLWCVLVRDIAAIGIAQVHHAAIPWPRWLDRPLDWLIVTPRMHWIHHSPFERETNANFGGLLSIWDRLLGTYISPSEPTAGTYGLHRLEGERFQTTWGMLMTPLRARSYDRL